MKTETQDLMVKMQIEGEMVRLCKYGENAWQHPAGLYSTGTDDPLALDRFQLIEGSEPSYNNWCDLDRGLQTMAHIEAAHHRHHYGSSPIALGLKHGNCCGAGSEDMSSGEAFRRMLLGDPRALFGGVVIVNFTMEQAIFDAARSELEHHPLMLDTVVAPHFTQEAIQELKRKNGKCRFLCNPALEQSISIRVDTNPRFRYVRGGFLVQPNYTFVPYLDPVNQSLQVYGPPPQRFDCSDITNLLLAWAIGSTSTSNTITLVKREMLIGNGVGQQDRVGAAELAFKRARDAGHDPHGAVAYSDSFFPFPDGPQVLIDAGIRAILSTSGSIRDKETIALCNKRGVTLYLLPDAEARGFYGH